LKFAAIADIHGNLAALEAVLADIEKEQVDLTVVLGDIINCAPDSKACWDLIQSLNYPVLRGNHERYIFDLNSADAPELWHSERFAPVQWTHKQFTEAEQQQMADLPASLKIPELEDIFFVHSTARSDSENMHQSIPRAEAAEMFAGTTESLIVRGHNHRFFDYRFGQQQVICIGSTGLPLTGNTLAQYTIFEQQASGGWQHTFKSVAYDVEATIQRFYDSGFLDEAWPMSRLLLREVATGTHCMVPYIRGSDKWSKGGTLDLEKGIENFLNCY